ncbi:MAG: hypothetical protein COX06_00365 [Candidatus Zambryskibacteria bacterium CG22_combo_CG10-13_8_21_14_all_42_17]|uniref:Methyltransferase FkbM domain-containing protein n=1 Tax=Candidatus Zambryskibacteria bacterium CG22_combo_CG10-13_8_21_14_all_42_17 TaxID=1975118 RepID=A0A2H0BEA9_9BACT|nr:MAG: hypothetical protein COX06_00365 [Candidatus Zambryskibacteria bacterium CG22_combo_CG10-13_8_21_14_all_42_17]
MLMAMNIAKRIRWKFLLGVFKIKRVVNKQFGIRRLDYEQQDIFILTDTLREWETRARSVRKEPKTVSWIEKNGGKDAVFYDIGANIGAYSLIAAARGVRVVAFEPAPQNIYKLHENILLNKLNERITVVPLMLAEREGVAKSYIKVRNFGASHSFSFHEQLSDRNLVGQNFLAVSLDLCVQMFSLSKPTMIKIDVDGAEIDLLDGATKILQNSILKHILIEVGDDNKGIIQVLTNFGFELVDQERSGPATTNYIFERL